MRVICPFHMVYTQHCYDYLIRNLFIQLHFNKPRLQFIQIIHRYAGKHQHFLIIYRHIYETILKIIILPPGSSTKSRDIFSYTSYVQIHVSRSRCSIEAKVSRARFKSSCYQSFAYSIIRGFCSRVNSTGRRKRTTLFDRLTLLKATLIDCPASRAVDTAISRQPDREMARAALRRAFASTNGKCAKAWMIDRWHFHCHYRKCHVTDRFKTD